MNDEAIPPSNKAYRNGIGWLRSLLSFLVVMLLLLGLHKATTPTEGALLGIAAVIVQIGVIKGAQALEERHTSRSLTVQREMQP